MLKPAAGILALLLVATACGGGEALGDAPLVDPLAARGAALAGARVVIEGAALSIDRSLESTNGLPVLRRLLGRDLDPRLGDRARRLAGTLGDMLTLSRLDASDGETAAWTVTPEALCGGSEECAGELARAPVRLVATSPLPDVLEVEVTAGDHPAGHVSLRPGEVRIQLELDGSRALALLLLDDMPRAASGTVELRLAEDRGAHHLEVSFPRAVELGGLPFSLDLAPASPAVTLQVDASGDARLDLALGAVAISGLVSDFFPCDGDGCTSPRPQRIDASLGSLTGTLEVSATGLQLRGFSLGNGPAAAMLDGMPLASLDLNAMNGRTIGAMVLDAGGEVQVSVEPLLDAALELHLSELAAAGVAIAEAWRRDLALALQLEGPPRGVVRLPEGDAAPMAHVLAGRLTLREGEGEPLVVEAGQCLTRGDDDSAPLFGAHASACY